jgi:hypothetical protein
MGDSTTLRYSSNEVGGDLVGNAPWKGVRPADRTGALQTEQSALPFTDGATSWHTVGVRSLDD